jgi:transposase-like protein
MKKSRYTEEQVTYALRLAESGTPVADVCRQMGIAEATFYLWKKKPWTRLRDLVGCETSASTRIASCRSRMPSS